VRTVLQTAEFSLWLRQLKDRPSRARLVKRLRRASLGLLGDVKPVGGGVWEMREFFGPGWRMYYIESKNDLIFMLCGGQKSSQGTDIKRAQEITKEL